MHAQDAVSSHSPRYTAVEAFLRWFQEAWLHFRKARVKVCIWCCCVRTRVNHKPVSAVEKSSLPLHLSCLSVL